jgi:hypothetical protein
MALLNSHSRSVSFAASPIVSHPGDRGHVARPGRTRTSTYRSRLGHEGSDPEYNPHHWGAGGSYDTYNGHASSRFGSAGWDRMDDVRRSPDALRRAGVLEDYPRHDTDEYAVQRPVSLLHGQTFLIPERTAYCRLAGLWERGRRHQLPDLDLSLLQYDFSGRLVEGGAVDKSHKRTEWEGGQGRWYTTAEYCEGEFEDRCDIVVNLETVAANVQSIFFVLSAPSGPVAQEHAPGIELIAEDSYGDEFTLASHDTDMLRLPVSPRGGGSTSIIMCRLWRAAPEERASYSVWQSGVRTQEGEWVLEVLGLGSHGRGGEYPRYGPITETLDRWLWAHRDASSDTRRTIVRRGSAGTRPYSDYSDYDSSPVCIAC